MDQTTNRKLTTTELRKILLDNYGPRISCGPGPSTFVIKLTYPYDQRRTVIWDTTYKLESDGFPNVTGRDIFQALLTPGQFECMREVSEPDDRTAAFLAKTCQQIGLLSDDQQTLKEPTIQLSPAELELYSCALPAVHLNAQGQWVVDHQAQPPSADNVETRFRFDHCPTRQQLESALLIFSIKQTLPEKNFRPDFHCLDCGRYCEHWLDIKVPCVPETPIPVRWKAFLDRNCGCDRSPSIVVEEF